MAKPRQPGAPAPPVRRPVDSPEAFAQAFAVSRETLAKLVTYEQLLQRWQKTINLVASSTLKTVWERHFADSAQLWAYRPAQVETSLDLGSGAGFPGMVLAIMDGTQRPTRNILVESDSRKAAFLREVARGTGVTVDILCGRIESPEIHAKVGPVDCVTVRALAPLPQLADLAAPFFGSSTLGVFSKGREVMAEIGDARLAWDFDIELKPSVTDPDGRVVLLTALKRKG